MKVIADLAPQTQAALANHDVIVFDGVCDLCSGFFRFITRMNATARFRFGTAQSSLGQKIYTDLGFPADDFETNLLIVDGTILERLDAFAASVNTVGWPWRALSIGRWLPGTIKDPLYYAIARNRCRIFGRTDVCMMPSPALQARFLTLPA